MTADFRKVTAVLLPIVLIVETSGCGASKVPAPRPPLPPAVFRPLQVALLESYDDLFKQAPKLEFSAAQIQRMAEYLDQSQRHCASRFENQVKELDNYLRKAQEELRRLVSSLA